MKVMILAAGRGERLRPLTERTPKPLLRGRRRDAARAPSRAPRRAPASTTRSSTSRTWREQIVARFGDGARAGFRIGWSREAEPLETAGGIAQARALLGEAPFLLVNADIWCEFDFLESARIFRSGKRLAHLVLVAQSAVAPAGDFSLERGLVGNATGAPRYTYAGIARALAAAGRRHRRRHEGAARAAAGARRPSAATSRGELYEGRWSDVGTPQRLAELKARLDRR